MRAATSDGVVHEVSPEHIIERPGSLHGLVLCLTDTVWWPITLTLDAPTCLWCAVGARRR